MKATLTLSLLLLPFLALRADPVISADRTEFRTGDDITISWTDNEAGSSTDWIGIYPQGAIPGDVASTAWAYLNNTKEAPADPIATGTITFTGLALAEGPWVVFLLADNGYQLVGLPIQINIVDPRPRIDSFRSDHTLADGSAVTLSWTIAKEENLSSLSLWDEVNPPIDVLGRSSIEVTPEISTDTTYHLVANSGEASASITIEGVRIGFFEADRQFIDGSPITLTWLIDDASGLMTADSLTLSDGTNPPRDVLGLSELQVTPSESKAFVLTVNGGLHSVQLQLFRAAENSHKLSVANATPTNQDGITVQWTEAAGGPLDWIGIYAEGSTPGAHQSVTWNYLNGTQFNGGHHPSGEMSFPPLPSGEYYVALFHDNLYEVAEGPIRITVLDPPPPPPDLLGMVVNGNDITLTWKSDPEHFLTYVLLESDDLTNFRPMPEHSFIFSDLGDSTSYTFTRPEGHGRQHFYKVQVE